MYFITTSFVVFFLCFFVSGIYTVEVDLNPKEVETHHYESILYIFHGVSDF